MKHKLLFTLLFVAFTSTSMAQDIIVTKQSERIDAKILEISTTEIKYKRTDNPEGPTYVLPREKVASVVYANGGVESFENKNEESGSSNDNCDASKTYNRLYRGLEFSLNAGANVLNSSLGYAAGFQPGFSIGRRFTEHMYLGISGAYIPGAETFPVYATLRSYVPFSGSRLEFITDVSLGYIIEGHGDPLMFTAVPGLQIPLNNYMDVRVGAGALIIYLLDKSDVAFMSTVNASIGFHSTTDPLSPKPTTLYNGLQIGADFGINNHGYAFSVAASYKISPKLAVGLGLGKTIGGNRITQTVENGTSDDYEGFSYSRFFIRGKYNIKPTGRLSPFVSLEMGICSGEITSDNLSSGLRACFSPAAGLSINVGANSILDIKLQYDWVPSKSVDDYTTYYGVSYHDRSLSLSVFQIKLGFTQTLNVLSNRKYSDTIRNKLKLGAIMD